MGNADKKTFIFRQQSFAFIQFFFYETETYVQEKVTLINDILTEAAFL